MLYDRIVASVRLRMEMTKESLVALFGDSRYEYPDTLFVFLKKENRPSSDKIQACLAELGPKYELLDMSS